MVCTCAICKIGGGLDYISYCPLHKSAPDLYEAVKWTLEDHKDGRVKLPVSTHTQLLKALAKADS